MLVTVNTLVSFIGNAPNLNGRQSETDGSEHDSNVDDERSGTASYPPPGMGIPASTMQQQPMYQMMPSFSSMYLSSVPSGVNVQAYMNSPIPYPHPYPGMAAGGGGELSAPPQSNRIGRGSGKAGSGGKVSGEKCGSVNETSFNSQPPLTPQDSNSSTDSSTTTLPPTMTAPPPHPPTNYMQMAPVQYTYPYFPQAGPPPPHITSAQHVTGNPLYIPHPTVPVYHPGPIYSSTPAAFCSTDNGIPHSAISVPVSMPPPSDLSSNHVPETNAFTTKEISIDGTYKNSNLIPDSASFEREGHTNGTSFPQENASTSSEVSPENYSIPNNSDQSIPSEVPCSTDKDESGTDENLQINDHSMSSNETGSFKEQSITSVDRSVKSDFKTENVTVMLGEINMNDEKEPTNDKDKESENTFVTKNGINIVDYKKTVKLSANFDLSSVLGTKVTESAEDKNKKLTETESNESKTGSTENVNVKSNSTSSQDVSSGSELPISKASSSTDIKSENAEESVSTPSAKTWASLFKESSSSKPKPSATTLAKSPVESASSTPIYANKIVDSHSNTTTFNNTSSFNGQSTASQGRIPQYKNSPMSYSSIADDIALPKIGGKFPNF